MTKFIFSELDKEKLRLEVLSCYGCPDSMKIKLLKYSENLTYLLYDETSGAKYVLRVFRPGYHEVEEMAGELTWIHQITQDTDVKTADVILGDGDQFVCEIHVEGQRLYCALFEYVSGKDLHDVEWEELEPCLERMGEIAAKLHLQVMHWPESSQLKRFSWDIDDLIGEQARWGSYTLKTDLPEAYKNSYKQAVGIIRERLEHFGRSHERFGLIHDDISLNNTLAAGDDIYLLDFDDCGFGWFLYDLPTIVLEDFGKSMDEKMKAVLRGYERIRPLSQEEKDEIDTFNLLKKIVRIGWIASRSDNDTVKKIDPDYFKKTAEMAVEYCKKYC